MKQISQMDKRMDSGWRQHAFHTGTLGLPGKSGAESSEELRKSPTSFLPEKGNTSLQLTLQGTIIVIEQWKQELPDSKENDHPKKEQNGVS
jgi:hypothetical protein